jgi:DHA1 family tetracycline resistance protein-like MFS transporter
VKKSPLLPIFLIVLVDILGLTIMLPLLPFYAEHLGASALVIGLLTSSYAFCQLIAGPILGKLSDSMGRKPLLIVSQIGTFIGFLILAASNTLWMVFLSRIIDGLTAGNLSLAQAYIADVTEPEDRAKSFGVIGIAFGIGFLIGPAVSGYLSQFGYVWPILAAASLSFSSIICTATLLPKVEPQRDDSGGPGGKRLGILDWKGYAQYFANPNLGPLLWQFFFFALSFSFFISGFALFSERRMHLGPRQVGYVFAWVGFLGIILQGGLMGRLVKWLGERTLVWTGFLVSFTSSVWLAFVQTLPQMIANATYGAYGGVIRPAITAQISRSAGKRDQGVVLGLTQSITSISQVMAPIMAGALIDRGYLAAWALAGAAVACCGMIAALRFKPHYEPATTP